MLGLLAELQRRIPDRWFLRRLLPAALFVVVALVGGGQLGHGHAGDVGLARERLADALRLTGGWSPESLASLMLLGVAVLAAAFAVPFVAGAVGVFASGAWPWWLMPLGRALTAARAGRWTPPDELGREAVRARAAGRELRADRLDARRARTAPTAPTCPTWTGDRLRATEVRVRNETGGDLARDWTGLLLAAPDAARTALGDARDGYDAACEALAWSAAVVLLGVWWWPAALVGTALWAACWLALRRAVDTLCRTTEAVLTLG